jgi:hypothetical protein
MRKSTIILMLIFVIAGIAMVFGLDIYTQKTRETFEIQQRLTRAFRDRGELAPGSEVRLLWENKEVGRNRPGLKVEVTPSEAVLGRRNGMRGLVRTIARDAPAAFGPTGDAVAWMRFRLFLPQAGRIETWIERESDGGFGDPTPPLPEQWPDVPKPPAPEQPPK